MKDLRGASPSSRRISLKKRWLNSVLVGLSGRDLGPIRPDGSRGHPYHATRGKKHLGKTSFAVALLHFPRCSASRSSAFRADAVLAWGGGGGVLLAFPSPLFSFSSPRFP